MRGILKPILVAASLTAMGKPAAAYDMDCAIMLCMAGGFPPSAVCSAAYAEMIRRITPWPSRPPFGICTYATAPVASVAPAAPAAPSGAGDVRDLDISTPDYAWLRRTRVLWWSGRSYEPRDEPRQWAWSVRSCDRENRRCRYLVHVEGSYTPWPATITTENGQVVPTPGDRGGFIGYSVRAVMMEYGDYDGTMDHSRWFRY